MYVRISQQTVEALYTVVVVLVIMSCSTVEEAVQPVGVDPKSSGKGSNQASGTGAQAPPEDPAAHIYKVLGRYPF